MNLLRAILIDPETCQIDYVMIHDAHQLVRQVYRHIRSPPSGVLLACGDTVWYAEPADLVGGQCYFAMPALTGRTTVAGRAVITGNLSDCLCSLDQIDAAVLWLAGPDWDGM